MLETNDRALTTLLALSFGTRPSLASSRYLPAQQRLSWKRIAFETREQARTPFIVFSYLQMDEESNRTRDRAEGGQQGDVEGGEKEEPQAVANKNTRLKRAQKKYGLILRYLFPYANMSDRKRAKTLNHTDVKLLRKLKLKLEKVDGKEDKVAHVVFSPKAGSSPWKKKMHLTSQDVTDDWSLLAALPPTMRKEMLPRLDLGLSGDLDCRISSPSISVTTPDEDSNESDENLTPRSRRNKHRKSSSAASFLSAEIDPRPPKQVPNTSRPATKEDHERKNETSGEIDLDTLAERYFSRKARENGGTPNADLLKEGGKSTETEGKKDQEGGKESQNPDSPSYEEMKARFIREALESTSDVENSPQLKRLAETHKGEESCEPQEEEDGHEVTEKEEVRKFISTSTQEGVARTQFNFAEELHKKDEIIKELEKQNRELKLKNMALEELLMQASLQKKELRV